MEHIKSFQSFTTYMSEVQNKKVAEEKANKQAQYAEFFKSKLQEYGVSSPAELDEEKRTKFFEELNKWDGSKKMNESVVNEADVKDEKSFKEYVHAMYKKAFGDKYDEKKADDVVAGLMKKHKGDWGAMVGAAQSSLGESFSAMNEAELSPLQKEYREYFQEILKEFDVKNQAELSEEKRKEFFNRIRAGWEKGKGRK